MVQKRPDPANLGAGGLTRPRCRVLHLFAGAQRAHCRVEMRTFAGVEVAPLNVAREEDLSGLCSCQTRLWFQREPMATAPPLPRAKRAI
jgi:hypothetical protein